MPHVLSASLLRQGNHHLVHLYTRVGCVSVLLYFPLEYSVHISRSCQSWVSDNRQKGIRSQKNHCQVCGIKHQTNRHQVSEGPLSNLWNWTIQHQAKCPQMKTLTSWGCPNMNTALERLFHIEHWHHSFDLSWHPELCYGVCSFNGIWILSFSS